MNKLLRSAALLLLAAAGARGTMVTTTFQVQITLTASCSITANNLNFGSNQGLLTSAVDGSTTLGVICSNTTPYAVALNAGTVSGSTIASRLMAGTSAGNTGTTLGFQLYTDAARSTIWGDGTTGSTVGGTGTGSLTPQTLTVYGRVLAQSTPKPDTYQTTITATVTY